MFLASTLARRLMRSLTISTCPLMAARCKGWARLFFIAPTRAPFCRHISTTARWPPSTAACKTVSFSWFFSLTIQETASGLWEVSTARNSCSITSILPSEAAKCNGVIRSLSLAHGSAPFFSKATTTCLSPSLAAMWRGVWPPVSTSWAGTTLWTWLLQTEFYYITIFTGPRS